MRRFKKANGGFKNENDENLMALAQPVLTAMDGNVNFTDPTPEMAELEAHMEDFSEKLAISNRRGSPYDTAIKNESREELEKVLAALAFYVNSKANGTLSILLSSGFKISQTQKRAAVPSKIQGVMLVHGRQTGQMVLRFNGQPNVRFYVYRYTQDKNEEGELHWDDQEFTTSSSRNNIIAPVRPGVTYYVSVRAINTAGTGDWSDPISWMAR